jgi:TolB protein
MEGKRLRGIVAAAACVSAIGVLGAVPPANAQFPGKNGPIVFAADMGQGYHLYTITRSGQDMRQITHGAAQAIQPDWSPDGSWIAYTKNDCHIAFIHPDGTGGYTVPPAPDGCEHDPVFTPDGGHLVFVRSLSDDTSSLWEMDAHGRDRRSIGGSPCGADTPEVSPDGQTVTFIACTPDDLNALWGISIEGGDAWQITPTFYGVTYKHDWAPDGSRIVISDNSGDPDHPVNMFTVRPDGTGLRFLTDLVDPLDRALAGGYSPNGRWIVYRQEVDELSALMIVRTDGQGAHAILPYSSFRPRYMDWGPA